MNENDAEGIPSILTDIDNTPVAEQEIPKEFRSEELPTEEESSTLRKELQGKSIDEINEAAEVANMDDLVEATPAKKEKPDENVKVPPPDPLNIAFQNWMDVPLGRDKKGRVVTRRMQVRAGPAPDLILGWLEIGFRSGLSQGIIIGIQGEQERANVGGENTEVVHVHGPNCHHD